MHMCVACPVASKVGTALYTLLVYISADRSRVLVRIALGFIELVHMYMPNGLGAAVCGSSGQLTRCQSVPTIGIRPSKVNRLSAEP